MGLSEQRETRWIKPLLIVDGKNKNQKLKDLQCAN